MEGEIIEATPHRLHTEYALLRSSEHACEHSSLAQVVAWQRVKEGTPAAAACSEEVVVDAPFPLCWGFSPRLASPKP